MKECALDIRLFSRIEVNSYSMPSLRHDPQSTSLYLGCCTGLQRLVWIFKVCRARDSYLGPTTAPMPKHPTPYSFLKSLCNDPKKLSREKVFSKKSRKEEISGPFLACSHRADRAQRNPIPYPIHKELWRRGFSWPGSIRHCKITS